MSVVTNWKTSPFLSFFLLMLWVKKSITRAGVDEKPSILNGSRRTCQTTSAEVGRDNRRGCEMQRRERCVHVWACMGGERKMLRN